MKSGDGPQGDRGALGRYRFDAIEVDAAAHTLLREGQAQALEPKAFAVLLALLGRPGELLGRDELLDQVWGHRHVTPGVLTRAIAQLRAALDDDPQHPRYIQTHHALGYRFIGILEQGGPDAATPGLEPEPVAPPAGPPGHAVPVPTGPAAAEPAASPLDGPAPAAATTHAHASVWRMSWWLALLAAIALGVAWWQGRQTPAAASEASIAVLPFTVLSDAREDRYYAEGLSMEMVNALAGLPGLKVAAWRPAEAIDRATDVQTQGRLLGVATVLDASLRRDGQRLRINARLSDTRSGYTLWSHSYDVEADAVFDTQADIAESVAQALVQTLPEDRQSLRRRLAPTRNVMAFDSYLRGVAELLRASDEGGRKQAAGHFRKALEADAGFARAQAALCRMAVWDFESNHNTAAFEDARLACLRARNMDQTLAEVSLALGDLYRVQGEQEQALRHYQAVIDDPALRWQGLVGRAQVYVDQGQEELAMRDFRQALRSSPGNAQVLAELGYQQYRLGHYRDAIDSYRKVVALRPDESVYWATFGGLLQMVGEDDPAEVAFRRSLALEPNESSLNNLGVILYRKGDYHGAAGLYRRAADLNPNDFYYLGNLGDALEAEPATATQARQAYADAAELAQRFVDAKPDDARALAVLGWYRAQLGQRDASLHLLQQAEALGREPGEVAILKAQALAVLGLHEQALAALQAARAAGVPQSRIASHAVFRRTGLASPSEGEATAPVQAPAAAPTPGG